MEAELKSIDQFALESAEALEAEKVRRLQEVQQRILDAPDCRMSKREMLGLKRPARKKSAGSMFGEDQSKLFGG